MPTLAMEAKQALQHEAARLDFKTRAEEDEFNLMVSKIRDEIDETKIISIEQMFPNFGRLVVNEYISKLVSNGVVLDERQFDKDEMFKIYNNGKLIAIYEPFAPKQYKLVVYLGE